MKYLVTGGAGFVGSHLIEKIIYDGNSVICVDDISTGQLYYSPESNLIKFINQKVQYLNGSDLDQNIDGIFHLAAQASVPVSIDNFFESSANNLLSTLKVWDICRELKIPVVYASSSAVYGNLPIGDDEFDKYDILSPYAQDKLTMEDYAMMCWNVYKVQSVGFRLFNVYGPRQDPNNPYSGVISIFINRLMCNRPVTVNGGYQTRDFIYVKDVADVMVQTMNHLCNNVLCEVINLGTGISVTIDHLLVLIAGLMNIDPDVIKKELPKGDPEKSNGTYEKLKRILNIETNVFVNLEEGLKQTIQYMSNNLSL